MVGGFRILLGIVAVVVIIYSAMSIWPILTSTQPSGSGSFNARNYTLTAPGNPGTTATQPPSQSASSPPGSSARPIQTVQTQTSQGNSELKSDSRPEVMSVPADWVYVKKTFNLLTEPGGNAHRAFSLCNAELELLAGTRLARIKTEEEWVLVRTPGNIYGWTHESLITTRIPAITERTWKLYPSGG